MKRFFFATALFSLFFGLSINGYGLEAKGKAMDTKQELSGQLKDGVRIIQVVASRYKFSPDPIIVKLGDKVKLILSTTDVGHGLAISEFNLNVTVEPGKTTNTEFIADKEGSFTALCSVYCGPGHMQMRGKFIVIK